MTKQVEIVVTIDQLGNVARKKTGEPPSQETDPQAEIETKAALALLEKYIGQTVLISDSYFHGTVHKFHIDRVSPPSPQPPSPYVPKFIIVAEVHGTAFYTDIKSGQELSTSDVDMNVFHGFTVRPLPETDSQR